MSAFVDDLVADSPQTVEDDGSTAAFHVVDGGAGEGEGDGGRDSVAVDLIKSVRHGCDEMTMKVERWWELRSS